MDLGRVRISGVAAGLICVTASPADALCFHPTAALSMGEQWGDLTLSGHVNVADVLCVVLVWLTAQGASPPPACLAGRDPLVADLDCSGQIDALDVQLSTLRAVQGAAPAGVDATGDGCPDTCQSCGGDGAASCWAAGACRSPGEVDAGDACLVCVPESSPVGWTAIACPLGEVCHEGLCQPACGEGACVPSIAGAPATWPMAFGDPIPSWTVTVSHPLQAADSIVVTATSDDESVVPTSAVSVAGPDAAGLVEVRVDYPSGFGQVGITIVATDAEGGQSAASTTISVSAATAVDIAVGSTSACAATGSGRVVCWGTEIGNASRPGFGQLGNGAPEDEVRFTPVPALGLSDVVRIEPGPSSFFALTASQQLYGWGRGSNGTNGPQGDFSTVAPSLIPLDGISDTRRTLPVAGAVSGGQAYMWGAENAVDEIFGDGPGPSPPRSTPAVVPGLVEVTKIAVGDDHACAVAGGSLYCWGMDRFGETGQGVAGDGDGGTLTYPLPQPVGALTGVVDVAAGRYVTCVIADAPQNNLYCMGWHALGTLGTGPPTGSQVFATTPQLVLESGVSRVTMSWGSGTDSVCALQDGGAYCWGTNGSQKLGANATLGLHASPVHVPAPGGASITALAVSASNLCFVASGRPYCQGGRAHQGILGDGRTQGDSPVPVLVNGFAPVED